MSSLVQKKWINKGGGVQFYHLGRFDCVVEQSTFGDIFFWQINFYVWGGDYEPSTLGAGSCKTEGAAKSECMRRLLILRKTLAGY